MALRINKQKNNKSGYAGVYYRKDRKVWVAIIQSRVLHLKATKHFDDPEKANAWRLEYLEGRPDLVAHPLPHCYKCNKRKEKSEFYNDNRRPRGVMPLCKLCCSDKNKSRYARKKLLSTSSKQDT